MTTYLSGDRPTGWRQAADAALYGPGGFYLQAGGPGRHFRTSVHASQLFAHAVARLLLRVDEALGRPDVLAFVDLGAGHGELTEGVLAAMPEPVASRTRAYAVERAARPPGLDDPRIEWTATPPADVTGLLFANEWLDNIPLDVVETAPDGRPYLVQVAPDGTESLAGPPTPEDTRWLEHWWPLAAEPGTRAEPGHTRDVAWADAVGTLSAGLAVAVDYAHARVERPEFGTLTGYRDGRACRPVPDGSCDLTAHVALDACAAAGALRAGAGPTLTTQRSALAALGVSGARPPLGLAATDPAAYVRALAAAGEAAELTAHGGLGDFGWLLQPVGVPGAGALLVDVADHEEQ